MTSGIRHFTDLSALSGSDLRGILDDAAARKARLKAGERSKPLEGEAALSNAERHLAADPVLHGRYKIGRVHV